jgi:dnd system-associated protein 4
MAELIDWRKLSVRRDSRFETLEERFCSTKGAKNEMRVFNTVKELMVFAALIGYQLDDYQPLESKVNTTPILLDTYATTGHDAYIYLLALAKEPSLDILQDSNLRDAIGIFEGYCNSGLKYIDGWLMNNIGESLVTNILFERVLEYLVENE